MGIKFIEHTADVKFRVDSSSLEGLFIEAANAMNKSIYQNLKVDSKKKLKVKVSGKEYEELMYNFLEEFLYLLDAKGFLVSRVEDIKIEGFVLSAVFVGDKSSNYSFSNEVKAVTFKDMKVEKRRKDFFATVVLDV